MKFDLLKKSLLTSFPYVSSNYLLDWGRVLLSIVLWIISFTFFLLVFSPLL